MPQTLKLIRIGDSLGVILPEEMLSHLQLSEGQSLSATATEHGYLLTAEDEQLAAGRELMQEYRETFAVLAK